MQVLDSRPGRPPIRRRHLAATALAASAALASVVAVADDGALFEQNCVACHGVDAKGVEGLGVNLVESPFVARTSEQDLVAFLKAGRMPDDPNTRTSRPMPSFSWVAEADLQAIAAYVKAKNAGGK